MAPDNIAQEKILCNVVLILFGQHCTAENPMQWCPRDSRQLCIRNNLVQCCLNTVQTTLHKKKPVQCCLNTLWTTLYSWKLDATLSKRLQTALHKKFFPFNVSGLCYLGPMQCCPRGSKHHCMHRTKFTQFRQCCLNSVYICVYQVFHVKKIESHTFFTMKIDWN